MRIVVVGCGKIGVALLRTLLAEGHELVVMDNSQSVLRELGTQHDVMCMCGNGADCDMLMEAGVDKAELFIAVTGSDELNMVMCFLAKRQGAKHTIARIRNPQYNDQALKFMLEQFELDMIVNPDLLTAQEMFHLLNLPAASKVETFSRRNFEMVELRLKGDSPLVGHRLEDLRERYKPKFLICVVQRGNEVIIPRGDFVLQPGDRVGITANRAEIWRLFKATGLAKRQAKDVLLLGASRTAYYLSKMLVVNGAEVCLIDSSGENAKKFSALLPMVKVLCGDGTHPEMLQEARFQTREALVCLTGMDEQNILMAYYAKDHCSGKAIAKVNREEMVKMAEQIGLENVISPRDVVVNAVLRYVRAVESSMGLSIKNLYKLMDGKAEALEFSVEEEAPYIGVPLRDLPLKDNILIAGLLRDREAIIPTGNDMILPDDRVVVIASQHRLNALADILQ